jgi:hypothetical protein
MNCKSAVAVAALFLAVTGCQSVSQLDQKPPTWTAVYQANWEQMANCIVQRQQRPLLTVTPTFSAGRANIVVTNPTGAVMGTFDVRAIQSNATEVAYRSIYGGPNSSAGGDARDKADRCTGSQPRRGSLAFRVQLAPG